MEINRAQEEQLLQLARRTIEEMLDGATPEVPPPADQVYAGEAATFVTLKIGGQLRGCIGTLEPSGSLWESVRSNSVNAAFHDARFMPLSREELARVHIDVSILTPARPLDYLDGDDLAARLRPGVDGVILRHGRAGATFLPQVWEQLPTPELFLGHLCRKAGLSDRCWCDEHPQIEVYQVHHFEERV